jgi:dihydrofolate synthase/folylpolyglutamate synthase
LDEIGSPHRAAPVVHVAGTNGKGSVCALASAMLQAKGLKVGTTTSPHLQQVNERICINGEPIGDGDLSDLLEEVETRADAFVQRRGLAQEAGPPLTYFEALVAAAFLHFQRVGVDVAVVEVGLGGRLDATTVVSPAVSVITSVGLDHLEQLGPDVGSVAAEKGGVLKPGAPAAVGALPAEAMGVVRSMARAAGAPLLELGQDFRVWGTPGSFSYLRNGQELEGLSMKLTGQHQVENAAVAIAAVQLLGEEVPALALGPAAVRTGLANARHAGRLEWLGPRLLVDGCHNVEAATSLAAYLESLPRDAERVLLLGCSRDKDIRSIAAVLSREVDRVLTTSCAHPRSLSAGEVAEALVGLSNPVLPAGPVEQALPLALDTGACVIAAGSLFLVGAVRDLHGVS